MIEYVDHLHEHFVDPVRIAGGRYVAPRAPAAAPSCTRAVDRRLPLPRTGPVAGAAAPTGTAAP